MWVWSSDPQITSLLYILYARYKVSLCFGFTKTRICPVVAKCFFVMKCHHMSHLICATVSCKLHFLYVKVSCIFLKLS
jgi:hypothetical protein